MREKKLIIQLGILVLILSGSCSAEKTSDASASQSIIPHATRGRPVLVGDIPCSFPITDTHTEMTILASSHNNSKHDNVYVWNWYEKMTGVDVNWITVSYDACKEAIFTALMNKSKVDLIMRGRIAPRNIMQYGENGLILNLMEDDLLKRNAPNCWAYLSSHLDTLASVLNPDGSIYSLPQVNSGAELRVSRKIFINRRWLQNVNMNIPRTTEDMYQLLKAFKEQDANGNGDPNDEIPMCSQDWLSLEDVFLGAFGLANRGVHNKLIDYDEETGNVRLIATSTSYKKYLEYFRRLYKDGLLDNQMFTMTFNQWVTNAVNDHIGVFANTNLATTPSGNAGEWIAVDHALMGPDGHTLWSAIRANFHSAGAAVIPLACRNPDLVLRWLDYFWTDEGTLFYHMGIENETFLVKDDGTYDYLPAIYAQITGDYSFDDIISQYSPYPGGYNPTVEIAPYFRGGEMAAIPANAAHKLFTYGPKEYWPCFTFTAAEGNTLNSIQDDIEKYIQYSRIDFINGKKPLSEWDSYCAQLEKLRVKELLAIYQAAVERYNTLNSAAR